MEISSILKKLGLKETGKYEGRFYVIDIDGSNEYAKMYSRLEAKAVNTEYPNFGTNTAGTTEKVTNYFELDDDGKTHDLFLIADFAADEYYLKIGERMNA